MGERAKNVRATSDEREDVMVRVANSLCANFSACQHVNMLNVPGHSCISSCEAKSECTFQCEHAFFFSFLFSLFPVFLFMSSFRHSVFFRSLFFFFYFLVSCLSFHSPVRALSPNIVPFLTFTLARFIRSKRLEDISPNSP